MSALEGDLLLDDEALASLSLSTHGERQSHGALRELEAEAIFILREAVAEARNPALLFSGGKDSMVLLHLAMKAFRPDTLPFPVVHIDTGHNFPEVLHFRDLVVERFGLRLVVGSVEESIAKGRVRLRHPGESRNAHQTITLLDTIREHDFDVLFGGARRDEERARAKERIVSHRDSWGQWDPRNQRPELWRLFNFRKNTDEHFRVFPLSNWTELDVWQYIGEQQLPLPSIYFAHVRDVVSRHNKLVPITSITPVRADEEVVQKSVRFRTVGDISCTAAVASDASDINAIIAETLLSQQSERGATRLDDSQQDGAMERRKLEGYF